MKFFERLSTGWKLGKTSLSIINKNRSLLLFPLVSGAALILISLTYFGGGYAIFGDQVQALADESVAVSSADAMLLVALFIFYIITYFVVIFFNVGLVHCSREILEDRETSFSDGINHASSRIATIFSWTLLAATVGLILKMIQEKAGSIGQIVSGLIGIVWGIATFFVVPVIAYEDVNPIQAIKRSGSIMKDKWGESIGASFSFGLFSIIGLLFIALPAAIVFGLMHPIAGIFVGVVVFALIQMIVSSANMVFITAAYQNTNDNPTGQFDSDVLDNIFYQK